MFWSSGAVMHIVAFSGQPERYFAGSEIKSLLLHTNQRNSLMRYLGRSFARDAEGNLIPLNKEFTAIASFTPRMAATAYSIPAINGQRRGWKARD